MAGFRKRVRASQGGRRTKRRKFGRRRRRGKRNNVVSAVTGSFKSIQYRARKQGIKRWRNTLWRDTMAKTHWRSIQSVHNTTSTGTTVNLGTTAIRHPESGSALTDAFWTATGGLQPIDVGETVPTFKGDIILRGGKIGIAFTAQNAIADVLDCEVYLYFTHAAPDAALLATPQPIGWDPSGEPEIATDFGKLLARRHFLLLDDNQAFQWEHRVRPRKIDKNIHVANGGKQYVWVIKTASLTSATDTTVQITKWHNFSFSADVAT